MKNLGQGDILQVKPTIAFLCALVAQFVYFGVSKTDSSANSNQHMPFLLFSALYSTHC